MKIVLFIFLLICSPSYAQKDSFLIEASMPMIHYTMTLNYQAQDDSEIEPYYAQFTDGWNVSNESEDKNSTTRLKREVSSKFWFTYAPPKEIIYHENGGLKYTDFDRISDKLWRDHRRVQLNCSRVENAKGEVAFIYFTIITGDKSTERQNPALAFQCMSNSIPSSWNPRTFVQNDVVNVSIGNLGNGTYFFNWWDTESSHYQLISSLWDVVDERDQYEIYSGVKRDLLKSKHIETGNNDYMTLYHEESKKLIEKRADCEKRKLELYKKIVELGFGNPEYFEKRNEIQFEINENAFENYKISDQSISPDQIENYLENENPKSNLIIDKLTGFADKLPVHEDSLVLSPFDFPLLHFEYEMNYSSIENVTVEPYYARYVRTLKSDTKNDTQAILPKRDNHPFDYWFNYSPSIQEVYNGDGMLVNDGTRGDHLESAELLLNCSKIINSKGEIVFIYYATILGKEKQERQNPCLAFEALEYGNSTISWGTRDFLNRPFTNISGYDLEKGTYFFNWYDEEDALNKVITELWDLRYHHDSLIRINKNSEDSLRLLYRNNRDDSYLTEIEPLVIRRKEIWDEYTKKKTSLYQEVIDFGYGDTTEFNKYPILYFDIRNPAFLSHKISNDAIDPNELELYLEKKKCKRPKAVKELLSVFNPDKLTH